MVHVRYKDRLGNNLLQFAIGYAIAKLAGVPLNADPIPHFPGTNDFRIAEMPEKDDPAMRHPPMTVTTSKHPDLSKLVGMAKTGSIISQGWLFHYSYFKQFSEELREILKPEDGDYLKTTKNDLVLHIRRADYFSPTLVNLFGYPIEPLLEIAKKEEYNRCVIITDDPDDVEHVTPFVHDTVIYSNSIMDDFRTLYYAKRVITTPSSFGWTAQWLGSVPKVWVPNKQGVWKSDCFNLGDVPDPRVTLYH